MSVRVKTWALEGHSVSVAVVDLVVKIDRMIDICKICRCTVTHEICRN